MTAVGMAVFGPALFFLADDGALVAEVSRLEGEMQAIEDAGRRKGCKLQFQAPPPPKKTAQADNRAH